MSPDVSFDPLGTILAGREAVRAAEHRDDVTESTPAEELNGFLWFTVGGERYAVEIDRAREVIRPRRVTPVPRAPAAISGVLSHRGALMPVLDLSEKLGIESVPASGAQRIVVVRKGGGCCGLLVDSIGRVVMVPASAVESDQREMSSTYPEFFAGIVRHGGVQFMLLDLDKILDSGGGST